MIGLYIQELSLEFRLQAGGYLVFMSIIGILTFGNLKHILSILTCQYIHQSSYLASYSSIQPSSHLFINPSIYSLFQPSIHQSVYLFINPAILFINPAIYSLIYSSIHLSIRAFSHLFINSSVYSSIQPSIHLYIH